MDYCKYGNYQQTLKNKKMKMGSLKMIKSKKNSKLVQYHLFLLLPLQNVENLICVKELRAIVKCKIPPCIKENNSYLQLVDKMKAKMNH